MTRPLQPLNRKRFFELVTLILVVVSAVYFFDKNALDSARYFVLLAIVAAVLSLG